MLTILAFLLTLVGSVNWLMIGLLQYDFVAGIFGFQASILSRIVYIIVGASSAVLVFKLFKGKGTINVFSKRNKQDIAEKISKIKPKNRTAQAAEYNVESGEDNFRDNEEERELDEHPRGLFDEHFDNRGDL